MRSSSSSGPDGSFASFLARSLDAVARDVPWAHARMCAALGGRRVALDVSGERLTVIAGPSQVRLSGDPRDARGAAVELRTTREVIVGLTEARATFAGAILAGDLVLRGPLDEVLAFDAGLGAFLHGAVRCAALSGLLDDFQRSVGAADDLRRPGGEETR